MLSTTTAIASSPLHAHIKIIIDNMLQTVAPTQWVRSDKAEAMKMCTILLLAAAATGCWSAEPITPAPLPPPPDVPLAAREAPAPEGPSVVLIIGCTIRRDQLTPYGGPEGLTPFLAEMAARGALFESAIDAAPWTRPGHTAVLTGYHAAEIGMIEPSARVNSRRLPEEVTTIAEHLYDAGYATIGLTGNPNLNAMFGFAQGFDQYYEGSAL
ncbi:MAG: hypothetical protein ACI8S6_002511, partial [Myxococcota bacterium]